MLQIGKSASARDKRNKALEKQAKYTSSKGHKKGTKVRDVHGEIVGYMRSATAEISTFKRLSSKRNVFKGVAKVIRNASNEATINLKQAIARAVLSNYTPVSDKKATAKINIANHGNIDKNPKDARVSHLYPVIDFIKEIGYKPIVDQFVFDKSGYGEYMFDRTPRLSKIKKAAESEKFPMKVVIDALNSNSKTALLRGVVIALKAHFNMPDTIEINDDGFVYDDGNALQIGFKSTGSSSNI